MKKITSFFTLSFLLGTCIAQISPVDFTSNGSFTVPVGVDTIVVEVVGAGGKGINNGGGGGGGAGYSQGRYSVTAGTIFSVIIGTSSGSTTGVSSLGIQATGGSNGTSMTSMPYTVGGGGAGGIGTGGNILNFTGGDGGGGRWTYFGGGGGGAAGPNGNGSNGGNTINWTGSCTEQGGSGGGAGGFPGGNGGKGAGFDNGSCTSANTNPAAVGLNYGGGGGAGNGVGSPGVDGAGGFVRISWVTCPITVDIGTSVAQTTITVNESGATYQWIDCGSSNSIIVGAISQSFTASVNGSYAVVVTDSCALDTSACVSITTVGIDELDATYAVNLYPNPMNNLLTIEFKKAIKNTQVLVVNIEGKTVYNGVVNTKTINVDGSTWNTGVYIVKIRNDEYSKSLKLIK